MKYSFFRKFHTIERRMIMKPTFRTSRRYFFGNFPDVRLIISNYTNPPPCLHQKTHQTRKCWTRKKSKPPHVPSFQKNNIFKLKIILALRCSLSDSYKTDFTPSRILQDHQKKLDTQLALVLDILSALFHDIMLAKLLVSNFAQSILNKALNLTTAVTLLMGGNLTPY